MKRLTFGLLLIAVVLLASCAPSATPTPVVVKEVQTKIVEKVETKEVTPVPAAVKPEDYVYVGSSCVAIPYTKVMQEGAEQAGKDINRKVVWVQPVPFDVPKQIQMTEAAISMPNLKGMGVIAADATSYDGLLKTLKDRGIPFVAHASCPELADTCFAADFVAAGKTVAERLGKEMGGKGNVVIAGGPIGAEAHELRIQGFLEVMKAKYPDIKILDTLKDCDTLDGTNKCAETALSKYPQMNAYYTTGSVAPLGAAQTFPKAGRKDILVTAVDDDPMVLAGIRDGTITFTYIQTPYTSGYLMIYLPYLMAEKGLKNVSGKKMVDTGIAIVDKANIDKIPDLYQQKQVELLKLFNETIMK